MPEYAYHQHTPSSSVTQSYRFARLLFPRLVALLLDLVAYQCHLIGMQPSTANLDRLQ